MNRTRPAALLASLALAIIPAAFAADAKPEDAKKKPDAAAQKKAPAKADGSVKPGDGSVKKADGSVKPGDGSVKPADTKAHKPFAPADAKADAAKATK